MKLTSYYSTVLRWLEEKLYKERRFFGELYYLIEFILQRNVGINFEAGRIDEWKSLPDPKKNPKLDF